MSAGLACRARRLDDLGRVVVALAGRRLHRSPGRSTLDLVAAARPVDRLRHRARRRDRHRAAEQQPARSTRSSRPSAALTILVVLAPAADDVAHQRQSWPATSSAVSDTSARMVDGTRDVFMMVDDDGRITYASPAATDLFGIDARPAGRPAGDHACSSHATRPGSPTSFEQMTIGTWDRVEAEIRRPDGTRRQLDAQCSRTRRGLHLVGPRHQRHRRDAAPGGDRRQPRHAHPAAQPAQLRDRAARAAADRRLGIGRLHGSRRLQACQRHQRTCRRRRPAGASRAPARGHRSTTAWSRASAATSSRSCCVAESATRARWCSPPMPSKRLPGRTTSQATRSPSGQPPGSPSPTTARSRRSCAMPTSRCTRPRPTGTAPCACSTRRCTTARYAGSRSTSGCAGL